MSKITARQLTSDTYELWLHSQSGGRAVQLGTARRRGDTLWHVSLRADDGALQQGAISGVIEVRVATVEEVTQYLERRFIEIITSRSSKGLANDDFSRVMLTTLLSFNYLASKTGTMEGFMQAIAMLLGVVLDEDIPPEGHAKMWADLKAKAEDYALESRKVKEYGA